MSDIRRERFKEILREKWGKISFTKFLEFKMESGKTVSRTSLYSYLDGEKDDTDIEAYIAEGVGLSVEELRSRLAWNRPKTGVRALEGYLEQQCNAVSYIERKLTVGQTTYTERQFLASHPYALIIAAAGMGKTTLLESLERHVLSEGKMPVYVDLSKPGPETYTDFKTAVTTASMAYKGETFPGKEDWEGSYIFLFDHLDMAPNAKDDIPPVIGYMNMMISERKDSKDQFIVCCRTNYDSYYGRLSEEFKIAELEGLDTTTEIEQLLHSRGLKELDKWHRNAGKLMPLARNPLHLNMIAGILQNLPEDQGTPITNDVQLFERFVEMRMEREDVLKHPAETTEIRKKTHARLAYEHLATQDTAGTQLKLTWVRSSLREIIPLIQKDVVMDIDHVSRAMQ